MSTNTATEQKENREHLRARHLKPALAGTNSTRVLFLSPGVSHSVRSWRYAEYEKELHI
jgi:hypothetical protein